MLLSVREVPAAIDDQERRAFHGGAIHRHRRGGSHRLRRVERRGGRLAVGVGQPVLERSAGRARVVEVVLGLEVVGAHEGEEVGARPRGVAVFVREFGCGEVDVPHDAIEVRDQIVFEVGRLCAQVGVGGGVVGLRLPVIVFEALHVGDYVQVHHHVVDAGGEQRVALVVEGERFVGVLVEVVQVAMVGVAAHEYAVGFDGGQVGLVVELVERCHQRALLGFGRFAPCAFVGGSPCFRVRLRGIDELAVGGERGRVHRVAHLDDLCPLVFYLIERHGLLECVELRVDAVLEVAKLLAQVLHGLQDLIAFVLDAGAASQQPVHEVEHFVQLLGVLRVDRFVQRLEGDRFRQAENDAVHLVEHPVPGAAHLGVVTAGRGDGGGVLVGVAFRLVGGIGCGIARGIRRRLVGGIVRRLGRRAGCRIVARAVRLGRVLRLGRASLSLHGEGGCAARSGNRSHEADQAQRKQEAERRAQGLCRSLAGGDARAGDAHEEAPWSGRSGEGWSAGGGGGSPASASCRSVPIWRTRAASSSVR